MKNKMTTEQLQEYVGKLLNYESIDFGENYPVVEYELRNEEWWKEGSVDVEIKDVISAREEFNLRDGRRWDHNGIVAWYVPVYDGEPQVIFDNAGGIILRFPGFACYYYEAELAADDISEWLQWENTEDWDGDDNDCHCREIDETDEVYSLEEIKDMSLREIQSSSNRSLRAVFRHLAQRLLNQ